MTFHELLSKRVVYFDGAIGTMLQSRGLMPGGLPELFCLSHPDVVTDIHREYVLAGSDIITTNTFQANRLKLGRDVNEVITAAVRCARDAGAGLVALDLGPTGQLLEPMGTLSFEDAYDLYAEQVTAGREAGADVIIIETMSDPYEVKAAILAAKENSDLPVVCTMSFQEDGRTFVGCDAVAAAALMQGLGVDALGVNCSLGPNLLMPVVKTMLEYAAIPVVVQGNAGLPVLRDGRTEYDITPEEYTDHVAEMVRLGVRGVGGCCGTTPGYIRLMRDKIGDAAPVPTEPKRVGIATLGGSARILDGVTTAIGERLNPTGKKRMQAALREKDYDYIIGEAIAQMEAGANALDVNVGLPGIDEPGALTEAVRRVQGAVGVPLQIDSSDPAAIEAVCRIYNGIPIINSVNGKKEVMNAVLPIAKKYGALLVCLTLDEDGIPPTAEGRLGIARRICDAANAYGIPGERLIIDCLVLTASAQQEQVKETLRAIKLVKSELGLKTVLGVSNVSFGLPAREMINASFFAAALGAGLDAAIINPLSERYREVLDSFRVLSGEDQNCANFISNYSSQKINENILPGNTELSLFDIINQGRENLTAAKVRELLETCEPLDIIDKEFIPALQAVGGRYEKGEIFLPQLMLSAGAVQKGFDVIHETVQQNGGSRAGKGKIVLATVKGDIHDIGKNIVKMLLSSYGYDVIDLGKDVPPEAVVTAVRDSGARLCGLSALMTTTVGAMEETIRQIRAAGLDCAVMAGGAVLTQSYAEMVGADYYAKDAMEGVAIANRVYM